MAAEKAWIFESSSSDAVYKTILHDDGHLSCDCRGWTFKRGDKPRECKHTKIVSAKTGAPSAYDETRGPVSYNPIAKPAKPRSVLPETASRTVARKGLAVALTPRTGSAKPKNEVSARFANLEFVEEDVEQVEARVTARKGFDPGPNYVAPMLASPMPEGKSFEDFLDGTWIMEEKYDGHRVTVIVTARGEVSAWSRPQAGKSGKPNARALPEHVERELRLLPAGTYDGELIVRRERGSRSGRSYDVTDAANASKLQFVAFDMVKTGPVDVTMYSYRERRELLEEAFVGLDVEDDAPVGINLASATKPSRKALEAIWARDGEGAILKRRAAAYQPGARSKDFIKIKKLRSEVMTIIGFESGKSGPFSTVRVRSVQRHVTFGFSETTVRVLNNEEMAKIVAVKGQGYIGRKLRIEFQERTPDGSYRHPRWDRWEDE